MNDPNAPTVDGHLEYEASTGIRKMTGYKKGIVNVRFQDNGQVVSLTQFPDFEMYGMMKGTRTFNFIGSMKAVDETNGYFSDYIFNPDKKGFFKRWFGSQKTSFDHFEGITTNARNFDFKDRRGEDVKKMVKDSDGKLKVYNQISGEWLDSISFDKQKLWEYNELRKYRVEYVNNPLPSDSRFRIDLIALLNEDLRKAQENKDILENIQRADRKLREAKAK